MTEKVKKKLKSEANNENNFVYISYCWEMFIGTKLVLELRL